MIHNGILRGSVSLSLLPRFASGPSSGRVYQTWRMSRVHSQSGCRARMQHFSAQSRVSGPFFVVFYFFFLLLFFQKTTASYIRTSNRRSSIPARTATCVSVAPTVAGTAILCTVQGTCEQDIPAVDHHTGLHESALVNDVLHLQFDADPSRLPFCRITSDRHLASLAMSLQAILHALLQHPQHLVPLHTPRGSSRRPLVSGTQMSPSSNRV
jgi:hypothetical protein